VLSFSLVGILSQQLIAKSNGSGRVMACEIMIPTMGVRNLIREDKMHQIYSAMQAGQDETGMQTMNQSLVVHVRNGSITKEEALEHSPAQEELAKMLAVIK
jgi:twitching motility protein PilT